MCKLLSPGTSLLSGTHCREISFLSGHMFSKLELNEGVKGMLWEKLAISLSTVTQIIFSFVVSCAMS